MITTIIKMIKFYNDFMLPIVTGREKKVSSPSGLLKVVGGVGHHEMEEILGVVVEQILVPDFAMVGEGQDQHLKEKMQICHVSSQMLVETQSCSIQNPRI